MTISYETSSVMGCLNQRIVLIQQNKDKALKQANCVVNDINFLVN